MSLEAKIEALTNAVVALTEAQTEHTERLNAVLAGGAKADDGEKPARKARAKKTETAAETDADTGEGDDDTGTTTTLTNDGVKKDVVAPWLSEFVKVEGDPETDARKAAIKKALASLVGKEGATVADVPAGDLQRLVDWVAKKKAADTGFGVGRLTEAPGAKKAAASADDDI